MAVPAYERKESKCEFLNNYWKLRKLTNDLIGKDFGLKQRAYDINLINKIYKLSEEDKIALQTIANKYGMISFDVDKIPGCQMGQIRSEVRKEIKAIGTEIHLANSIWLTEESYPERRKHWEAAIGYCRTLQDSFQELVEDFKLSPSTFTEVSKSLEKQIALLKGVRKSDNRILKK